MFMVISRNWFNLVAEMLKGGTVVDRSQLEADIIQRLTVPTSCPSTDWGCSRPFESTQLSPAFRKFILHHSAFRNDLFLLSGRNPKKIFTFYKKKKRQKQGSAFILQRAVMRGSVQPEPPSSFPRKYTQHLSINPP